MAKKSLSPSDTVFRFDIPGSPRKAGTEAPHSSTDSPGSVFLRNLHNVEIKSKWKSITRESFSPNFDVNFKVTPRGPPRGGRGMTSTQEVYFNTTP